MSVLLGIEPRSPACEAKVLPISQRKGKGITPKSLIYLSRTLCAWKTKCIEGFEDGTVFIIFDHRRLHKYNSLCPEHSLKSSKANQLGMLSQ